MRFSNILHAIALILVVIAFISCGQSTRQTPVLSGIAPIPGAVEPSAIDQPAVTWPGTLPEDKAQPWEELDANGHVIPPKGASNLNFDSIFASGIERYLEAGDVTDFGEASSFASGAADEESVSYAIYRLALGLEQPGTIAADVNVHNGSSYYIGVGDYSVNSWHWHGPFDVTHVRFNVPDAEYASGIGNLMLSVVAYDGASFDVVALGANVRDAADTEAPAIPDAPTLAPVAGGVFAEWNNVAAGDLAGYRIYADGEPVLDYIEGGTSIVVPATSEVEVTLTAVDISGNESALSDPATETPLAGEMPSVELTATAASGARNDSIALTATGGETYDWDIDGDGVWDFTNDPTDTRDANTENLGVIRPAIRAHTSEGGFSLNAISLFITGNFRPVVMATADVTYGTAPLDVNFTIVAEDDDGTIDEYAWDFDGDGTFDDSSFINPSPLPNTYSTPGLHNAKFRATDNNGAWDVDTVSVYVSANSPPVAILLADPMSGDPPLTTVFDASQSFDLDGSITDYEWDLDNDGIFSEAGEEADAHGSDYVQVDFSDPGYHIVVVRVTDDEGADDEGEAAAIAHGWAPQTLDSAGSVGYYSSLAIVNGYPAISYYNLSNGDLKYVRASDGSGNSWDTPVTVDSTGDVGYYISLAVVNGYPAISYYDITNNDLKYVRATDASGSSWDTPVIVDSTGDVGGFTSLAVVNGNPAISYFDWTNSDLKYVRADDADGGTWGTPVPVDSAGNVGLYTSLAIVNGNPAVSYLDSTNGNLKYVRASDASGSFWGIPIILDSAGLVGYYTSLAVVNGYPAISYFDNTNDDLKYVRANDADGSAAWETPLPLDSTGNLGYSTSLAVVDGNPAISYLDYTNDGLKYVRADDADGSTWGTRVAVDSAGYLDTWTSLAVVNGSPAISYYSFGDDDLKFVRLY